MNNILQKILLKIYQKLNDINFPLEMTAMNSNNYNKKSIAINEVSI